MNKLGYLCSEFPALSHTFITREILVLEGHGIEIVPCSVNPTRYPERLTGPDVRLAERTEVLKRTPLGALVKSALGALFHMRGWRSLGFAVRLCALAGPRDLIKALGYWGQAVLLDRWALSNGIHHVHVHFANPAATVALIATKLGRIEYSLSVHGPDEFFDIEQNNLREKILSARFVRCISYYCRSQLMRLLSPRDWAKLHIVRCGVYQHEFSYRERTGPVHQILCVGRLCPAKGQAVLLGAARKLLDRGASFHIAFLGGGEDEELLRREVDHWGLGNHITLAGAVAHSEVSQALQNADIFVLPSFAEGVPVALMEAMASGVPVVSSRTMGIPELIEHGANGFLIAPSDEQELTDVLDSMINGERDLMQVTRNARATVENFYDVEKNTADLAGLFLSWGS